MIDEPGASGAPGAGRSIRHEPSGQRCHPSPRIRRTLDSQKSIAGLAPADDAIGQIVEDEIASIGAQDQYRVRVAPPVEDRGDEKPVRG